MPEMTGLLRGKRGLIMGVANNPVNCVGHCQGMPRAGRETWRSPTRATRSRSRWSRSRRSVGGLVVGHCDVTEPADPRRRIRRRCERPGARLDFVVHAIAFSDKDQLDGRYVETTRGQLLARRC